MARGDRVVIYRDEGNRWRWRRYAGNNRTSAASEQGYRSKWYCKRKARRLNPGVPIRVEDV